MDKYLDQSLIWIKCCGVKVIHLIGLAAAFPSISCLRSSLTRARAAVASLTFDQEHVSDILFKPSCSFSSPHLIFPHLTLVPHLAFDSSVGRAVDCSWIKTKAGIHRSLVRIRLEGGQLFSQAKDIRSIFSFRNVALKHQNPKKPKKRIIFIGLTTIRSVRLTYCTM